MLIVELSNHPADMLDDASRRREAAGKRALSRYEDELIQYRARVQAVRVKRDRARAERRWKKFSRRGSRARNWSRSSWAARWMTTGRCCGGTGTDVVRLTTCCSARRGSSPSR